MAQPFAHMPQNKNRQQITKDFGNSFAPPESQMNNRGGIQLSPLLLVQFSLMAWEIQELIWTMRNPKYIALY